MKLLIFDPSWGASGDMILGCLLELGLARSKLESIGAMLDLTLNYSYVERSGIKAIKLGFQSITQLGTRYVDLIRRIQGLDLAQEVIQDAIQIYQLIAQAECKLHGVSLDQLRLHELGSNEAMFEIVGTCWGIKELNPDGIWSLPVSVGAGFIRRAHGILPVPAPVTLELLSGSGMIWRGGPVQGELLTPTGAALLRYFIQRWCEYYPQLSSAKAGYSAGSLELEGGHPNLLRGVLGQLIPSWEQDQVEILETNVDHLSGQLLGWLPQKLIQEGALDVTIIPALMKKGRPGYILQVLVQPQDSARIAGILMQETGSLGVRFSGIKHRFIASRQILNSELMGFRIRFKISKDLQGNLLEISPEYEDVKQAAIQSGIPFRELMEKAKQHAQKLWSSGFKD